MWWGLGEAGRVWWELNGAGKVGWGLGGAGVTLCMPAVTDIPAVANRQRDCKMHVFPVQPSKLKEQF